MSLVEQPEPQPVQVIEPGSQILENARWETFCRLYVFGGVDGKMRRNATSCYISAGYNPKNRDVAATIAEQLLRKPEVNQRVAWLEREYWRKLDMEQDEVIARTAAIARFDPSKLFDDAGNAKPLHEVDEQTRMALAGIEVELFIPNATEANPNPVTIATRKVKAADKLGALRLLMQQKRMVGDGSTNIQVNIGMADRLANARKRLRERRQG